MEEINPLSLEEYDLLSVGYLRINLRCIQRSNVDPLDIAGIVFKMIMLPFTINKLQFERLCHLTPQAIQYIVSTQDSINTSLEFCNNAQSNVDKIPV